MVTLRKATTDDVDFLVENLISAEKAGTDVFSYSRIFEITEAEFAKIAREMMLEDMTGQEFCISDYLIAEWEGQAAGAVSGWIEGESGKSSTIIKGVLFSYFFPKDKIKIAAEKNKVLEQIHIPRKPGTLQIESGAVRAEFRGKGILNHLMLGHEEMHKARVPELSIIEGHLLGLNKFASRSHERIGYTLVDSRQSDDPRILELIPGNMRILMHKYI